MKELERLYAAGRKIFPVKYRDKRPLRKGWQKCNIEDFNNLDWNKINKGMLAGIYSQVTTLDLDFKHKEAENFWNEYSEYLSKGVVVSTGNGKHCHFQYEPVLTAIGGINRGVDLICDTQEGSEARYVVIPTSLHPKGGYYEYDDPFGLTLENKLPPMPDVLMDLIKDKSKWKGSNIINVPIGLGDVDVGAWYAENPHALFNVDPFDDAPIKEGARNEELAKIAGKFLYMNSGNDDFLISDLEEEMHEVNKNRCNPPVDALEVDCICKSVWKTHTRKASAVKGKDESPFDGFKIGADENNQMKTMGLAFSSGVIPCPPQKPEVKTDLNLSAVWLMHQEPFAPSVKGGDHNLLYLEDTFYQRYENVWRQVTTQAIESIAQSYFFNAKKSDLSNLMNFTKNYLYVPFRDMPFWKAGFPTPGLPSNPRKIIPFNNGLFDVEAYVKTGDMSSCLKPFSDNLFNTIKLPYEFKENTKCPAWESFLASLWGSAKSERALALQQWMGHMMIPDITMQKIALLHGLPRSGKSTIGRVILNLIGAENTVATNMQAMTQEHGMAGFVGKTMAVLFDAHLGPRGQGERAIEILKGISGGDPQNINRKFCDTYTVTLTTRIMIICNDMPRLKDAGDALLARLIPFRFEKSFIGVENPTLEAELIKELPGIAMWAMKGIKDYMHQGYLSMPKEGIEDLVSIKRVLNPVSAFMDDCIVYPAEGESTPVLELHKAWLAWCDESTIHYTDTKDRFLNRIKTLIPGVVVEKQMGLMSWKNIKIREEARARFFEVNTKELF